MTLKYPVCRSNFMNYQHEMRINSTCILDF